MRRVLAIIVVLLVVSSLSAQVVLADGSRNLFPDPSPVGAARANLQYTTSSYGPGDIIRYRIILYAYLNAGEFLLMGSTAVGVNNGNIFVYNPGAITGAIGTETVGAPTYDCQTQRTASGLPNQGVISSRAQELAGPDTVPGGGVVNGYEPCTFQAPATGIYGIVFHGPSGEAPYNTADNQPGDIALTNPNNFNATQTTSVAAWDVTVRDALNSAVDITGRVYTYYLGMRTGANGRPVYSTLYTLTNDGFVYQTDTEGFDPFAFVMYSSQRGFLDSDGVTPLYHDVLSPSNTLASLDGGVGMDRPTYPMFFAPPQAVTKTALGIPVNPTPPLISNFVFNGSIVGIISLVSAGGDFEFDSTVAGSYELIISQDGVDFSPTTLTNRVLRGNSVAGTNVVNWDGLDNEGTAFPVGLYSVRLNVRSGEYHFPMLDAENSINGGPSLTLINPPGGTCPPLTGGCSSAFYDDRSYRTLAGNIVGGAVPNTILCGNLPPAVANSDLLNGFDSTTNQRAYGAATGGHTGVQCTGAFGDMKGLDIWTYYPSNTLLTPLEIVNVIPTMTPVPPPPGGGGGGTGSTSGSGQALPTFPPSVTQLPSTGISPLSATRPLLLIALGLVGAAVFLMTRRK